MPLQDLSVGSTASRRSSSGLGSRQSEPTPEKTSWWSNFKSTFASSGGDDSNMSNPEQPVNALPIVDFGDDDSSAADIYDEPQFTYEPEVYAAIRDASKSSAAYTPDEILQEAYDADMAGKGEDKPDPLGNMGVPPATLVDVTDTDEGALTNPDPLYKMAEEVRTPTITTTPLDQEAALREALMEGQPTGLMSRPSSFVGDGVQVASALTGLTSEADIAKAIAAALGEEDISPPEADDQLLVPTTATTPATEKIEAVEPIKPADSNSIMSAVRKADVTTDGVVDISKVQNVIINNVGNNIYSAALLGAIKTEIGEGIKDEEPWYSVAAAKDVWLDADVVKGLNKLPKEQKARLLEDEKSGKRKGGQATSSDRKALGEAMWDIKYEGGKKYKGRGLIQITHKTNYKEVGKRIGLDLVKNPELVNDPKYAVPAAIAYMDYKGFFDLKPSDITKNKLQDLINPKAPDRIKNQRWEYATEYLKQIREAGGSSKTSPRPMLRPK